MIEEVQTPQDRPLVTFALFAYNQEKYIREAVEGAFSQTYEPLKIILSDDCSSDRTFDIMKEMAATYDGPHEVKVRRNEVNFGLIEHVNDVCRAMEGSILILAAGDDVSLPSRTANLTSIIMKNPRALLAHSSAFTIDRLGEIFGEKHPPKKQELDEIVKSASIYIGATGAVHRRLIDLFDPIKYRATYEDLIFGTRAALAGEIVSTDEKLVKYRSDGGITSNTNSVGGRVERRRRKIIHRIETLKQRRLDVEHLDHSDKDFLLKVIDTELTRATARNHFYDNRICFLDGLAGPSRFAYLKAASSEIKYILGVIH